tara:strand:+ start:191 stop:832 length:642 start_codon:yes stop_codon:yes gene_type:complete
MVIKEKVIDDISEEIYKNDIKLNTQCGFYLSHVVDDIFCIFTKKPYGNMFTEDCNDNLNPFFSKLGNMLLTDNLSGEGCFDYENYVQEKYKSIKDKMNNYLSYNSNFLLIKYSLKEIKPLSYFTISTGYIWTICTNSVERKKGYMSLLFKHFLSLLKKEELKESNDIIYSNNNLHLNLLKKNPTFDKTKSFYEECGFKLKEDQFDKIVMVITI